MKPQKVLVLGDMHFAIKSSSHVLCMIHMHNMNQFLDKVLFPYIIDNGITHIYQTGDMFDNRKANSNIAVMNAKTKFFDRLQELGVQLITIVGNHDALYANSVIENSLHNYLKEYSNVTIISEPRTIDSVDFIPWICEDNVVQVLDFIAKSTSQVCVCHPEIVGFNMNQYQACESGMDSSTFANYKLVLAGHFHDTSRKGNILYVGTPLRHNYGEVSVDKGFWILDTTTHDTQFIINPHNLFEKIVYSDSIRLQDIPEVAQKYISIQLPQEYDIIRYKAFVKSIWEQEPHDVVATQEKSSAEYDGVSVSLSDIENKSFALVPFLAKYTKTVSDDLDESVLLDMYSDIYARCVKDN